MEVKFDPKELMNAAVANMFAQADPQMLAAAMAETVLSKSSYGGNRTVLDELIGNAVRRVADDIIKEVMEQNKEAVRTKIVELLGDDITTIAVQLAVEKVKGILK